MIPELVGRIPVIVTLNDLDKDALVKILKEPKNSIIKQYEKLFEMDGVELDFNDDALMAIATQAIERHTGARGLRSIMEELMMPVMYEIPSRNDISEVVITEGCVKKESLPEYVIKENVLLDNEVKISGELE